MITVGVDVGQKVDPTAIIVAEGLTLGDLSQRRSFAHHYVRHIERLPLGTPYPAVALRLARLVDALIEQTKATPTVYVDATGVGWPVLEMMQRTGLKVSPVPVYFTYGDRRTKTADKGVSLGKAWLVSRLQALLQGKRLHLPRTKETAALTQELLDYEIRVDTDANERYGAFRVGSHDDLVTALGLATQLDTEGTTGAFLEVFGHRRAPTKPLPTGPYTREATVTSFGVIASALH